jgi:hypothetical protein
MGPAPTSSRTLKTSGFRPERNVSARRRLHGPFGLGGPVPDGHAQCEVCHAMQSVDRGVGPTVHHDHHGFQFPLLRVAFPRQNQQGKACAEPRCRNVEDQHFRAGCEGGGCLPRRAGEVVTATGVAPSLALVKGAVQAMFPGRSTARHATYRDSPSVPNTLPQAQ